MKKFLLILVGVLTWSITMVKSGINYSYGLGFWGANGHDGIWHLAVINSLKGLTLNNPIFSGAILENYHLGFDIFVAAVSKVLFIPTTVLYFQILPVIFSLLIGLCSFSLVKKIFKSDNAALWSVFFVYFGTGFGWLINKGESVFWSQQAISTLINPPYAMSLIILTLGVIFMKRKNPLPGILCFTLLPQVKIYAGVLAYFALLVVSIKDRSILKVFIPSLMFGFALFFLLNKSSTSLIVINPGWFLETLFAPDRLNIPRILSALSTYKSGMVFIKLIPAYSLAFLIFLLGNLGSRFIAILSLKKKPSTEEIFLYITLVAGVILPMIFTQRGTAWNTIQFFYYTLFVSSLLSGPAIVMLSSRIKNSTLKILIIAFLVILTLPGTMDSLKHYLPARPPAMLPNAEISALNYLKKQPQGIVLTQPFNANKSQEAIQYPPRPLQLYESTAYVSAFSNKQSYLEDQVNANILGLSWEERRIAQEKFFLTDSPSQQDEFLANNNISYIYSTDRLIGNVNSKNITKIYDENGIKIYKTTLVVQQK